jgi:hypothetical protein
LAYESQDSGSRLNAQRLPGSCLRQMSRVLLPIMAVRDDEAGNPSQPGDTEKCRLCSTVTEADVPVQEPKEAFLEKTLESRIVLLVGTEIMNSPHNLGAPGSRPT